MVELHDFSVLDGAAALLHESWCMDPFKVICCIMVNMIKMEQLMQYYVSFCSFGSRTCSLMYVGVIKI